VSFRDLQIYIDDFEEFAYTYTVSVELSVRFGNNALWVQQCLCLDHDLGIVSLREDTILKYDAKVV
jgi:hypothetical protein